MLTQKDLKQIENLILAHQNDLKVELINRMEESQDDLRESLEKKITEFKSDILDAVDKVLGEIIKSREEQTVISGLLAEHSDKLEDHEEKINKLLEKTSFATPA
ncbi:MAG: hypothetical protein M1514_02770 [Patescibacteria group bacterium]|nr:hypothetical protein [Patescibacteria group bacterium]